MRQARHRGATAVTTGAARWAVLEVSRDVAERAAAWFPDEPVRSRDAIHLASALVLRRALPDLGLLTTGNRMRRNATRFGFDVLPA